MSTILQQKNFVFHLSLEFLHQLGLFLLALLVRLELALVVSMFFLQFTPQVDVLLHQVLSAQLIRRHSTVL